jgi:hypothetical protein
VVADPGDRRAKVVRYTDDGQRGFAVAAGIFVGIQLERLS